MKKKQDRLAANLTGPCASRALAVKAAWEQRTGTTLSAVQITHLAFKALAEKEGIPWLVKSPK